MKKRIKVSEVKKILEAKEKIIKKVIRLMGNKRVELLFHFPNHNNSEFLDDFEFNVSNDLALTIENLLNAGHTSGELNERIYDDINDLEYDVFVTWKLL